MQTQPKAVILMYHRITRAELDPWGMCVTPEHFSEHLDSIKRVASPMSLTDFVRARQSEDLPERTVIVTFDDGYVDNFEQALPIIRQHQVPATLFITTCNIDTDREFWWDRLETQLLATGRLPDRLELQWGSGSRTWELGSAASYDARDIEVDRGINAWSAAPGTRLGFFYDVWKTLWPLEADSRSAALDQLSAWTGNGTESSGARRTMTSEEIRLMGHESLMTIGAHTVDHPPLPAHASAVQSGQIMASRRHLEEILGLPVTTFAYPHGEYSPETIRLLEEEGFECAVTVEQKLAGRDCHAMVLPRFGVKDMDGPAFESRLRTWFGLPLEIVPAL